MNWHDRIARGLEGHSSESGWRYQLNAVDASDLLDEWEAAQQMIADHEAMIAALHEFIRVRIDGPEQPPAWTVIA